MSAQRLHGSCSCGRFRHIVDLPSQYAGRAELRYDNSSASRQHSASPLTLWLRVPLPWYTSATFAQYPDETHSSIQRTFSSHHTPATSNKFCGYCGTQLSSWNERTRDEAEHICLPVGSLLDEDQELLSTLGFFGDSSDEETSAPELSQTRPTQAVVRPGPQSRGAPWFEEIVRNTRLGRYKQQRGGHSDNGVQVEWEVTEWIEGGEDDGSRVPTPPSKRKIGHVEAEDSEMQST
ncbi:hypothetical protein E8E13_007478 [Curvularia kusanoi]|uniref:CENP-V/GFA domain-containing protein n=1 Tax=Curvularia kusanoi TaxID=90978 RepID=A0A9P4W8T1_CURKU|nr:hypothetical protein E8E13_007478 [Curvularia kusanoi]